MFLPADVPHRHEENMQIQQTELHSLGTIWLSLFGFFELIKKKSLMTNGTFALVALVSMRRPDNRSMLTDWWQIFLFKGWRDTDSHLLLQTTRDQCDGALSWSICSKKDLWISSSKYAFQVILYRLQKHSLHWFLRLYLEFKKLNSFRYTHVCVRGKLE